MPTWIIYALLSMVFAGLTAVIAKLGLKNVSGDAGLAVRTTFVFLLVWINAIAFRHVREFDQLSWKDVLFLGISGVTTTLSWIFYYRAIKIGDVSTVAVIDKASIVITLILSFWILKEPFTWRIALATALIVSGLLVLTVK
ncbi:MAG: EamA family transporter [Bacteroidetes bacterium]|nr:EamA family transporter [Bacteroidota bacterium]MBS1541576.1 EamA family transporter [Bacteroidota bacterium]